MFWTYIHIIDILLWLFMACSVGYVLLFAIASLIRRHAENTPTSTNGVTCRYRFLVLYPAYREDSVICQSVTTFLHQDYPQELYDVTVISDHMEENTNAELSQLPINLLTPCFEKSSKAKALQFAIANTAAKYDYVVILDADNIVGTNFLSLLAHSCSKGYKAIQCHRCAKNSDNDVAMLDGISEEINNTIFRKAHNNIGLSSALIGSGMCFDYDWFHDNVRRLTTAGEDRELEALLMQQKIFIKYEEDIHVQDEKVSNKENFQRQRQRWMSAQINSLCSMLPHMPSAIIHGNINFIDKTIQQMLVPRSILIVATLSIAIFMLVMAPVWSAKWWLLFFTLCLSLAIAIPKQMRSRALFRKLAAFPSLTLRMFTNIRKIDHRNQDFIHTKHDR